MGYFLISEEVVDRNDLTIEEKMACVVLARYADIKDLQSLLSIDIIAVKMGCSIKGAQSAVEGLIEKGILLLPQADHETIIPKERGDLMPSYVYQTLDDEQLMISIHGKEPSVKTETVKAQDVKPVRQATVQKPIHENVIKMLKDHFEEIVSEANIRLMLNLTDGDERRIIEEYERCRKYPYNQRIEKLVDHLQGFEHSLHEKEPSSIHIPKSTQKAVTKPAITELKNLDEEQSPELIQEDYDALLAELSANQDIKHLNQQINVKRIKQLYTTYGKK